MALGALRPAWLQAERVALRQADGRSEELQPAETRHTTTTSSSSYHCFISQLSDERDLTYLLLTSACMKTNLRAVCSDIDRVLLKIIFKSCLHGEENIDHLSIMMDYNLATQMAAVPTWQLCLEMWQLSRTPLWRLKLSTGTGNKSKRLFRVFGRVLTLTPRHFSDKGKHVPCLCP